MESTGKPTLVQTVGPRKRVALRLEWISEV
jgi:hypothetical protein